jgi:hypothetical protein
MLKPNRSWTGIEIRSQDVPDGTMGNQESIPICRETKAGRAPRFVSSKDLTGVTAKSKSAAFLQRYNLSLDNTLYPLLVLSAGGVFVNSETRSEAGSTTSTGNSTQISPYASLAMRNSFFPTSIGYQRREEKSESNGVASPTKILESYSARTALKPEGLPPVDFAYTRSHAFDAQKVQQDITSEIFNWGSSYAPINKLSLGYQGAFTSSANAISRAVAWRSSGLTARPRKTRASISLDSPETMMLGRSTRRRTAAPADLSVRRSCSDV